MQVKDSLGVLVIGRMGNQLFQYAFAFAQSRKMRCPFVLVNENKKHKLYIDKYFKLPLFNSFKNKIYQLFWRKRNKLKNYARILNDLDPDDQLRQVEKGKLYHGFYQANNYFKEYEEQIVREFEVKKIWINKFKNKNSVLFTEKPLLTIHVRGGDYLENIDIVLGTEYYKNCLSKIKNLDNHIIVVVTDDKSHAEKVLPTCCNYHYSNGSEIEDFLFMVFANKVIISNSSFAWWAAYLNKVEGKEVYAPKYWFGIKEKRESPRGIMYHQFIPVTG